MRLTRVVIRDYRSIFADGVGRGLELELGRGMNTFVGPNNCGKSNVLRAIALALDPTHPYDPAVDTPGPRPFAHPIVTLWFEPDGDRPEELAALEAAQEYEDGLAGHGSSHAADGRIVLQVAMQPTVDGVRRRELLLTGGDRTPSQVGDEERLAVAIERLREAVRFVLIRSGESLESVLEGNFREILHSVVRERLGEAFAQAEHSRQEYVDGLAESLLAPLRDRLTADVGQLFPEIAATALSPEVPSIERTLSNVGITLEDVVDTPLMQKGTGVRGGVLVAMLSYLALNANRGMVFAVEEPEAFLHPAAQEDLRDHLERVAACEDVSLLVTSHSPFIATRSADGRVHCLSKDREGRTRLADAAAGDAPHAPLLGGLFRETTYHELLAAGEALPDGTKAVLLVEGHGDQQALELAARVVDRPDLLEGLQIRPGEGTVKIVAEAVITRAAVDVPVGVLLDNDGPGKKARDLLTSQQFKFQNSKQVMSYRDVFDPHPDFPYEAVDLFAPELIEAFVDEQGPSVVHGSLKRSDDSYHYDFDQAAKDELDRFLAANTRPEHIRRWLSLILLIRERFELDDLGVTEDDLIAQAPAPDDEGPAGDGVLVVNGPQDHARYLEHGALVLSADEQLPEEASHVAFYHDAAIQPPVPAILGDYPGVLLSTTTAQQLRATGGTTDERLASVIEAVVNRDTDLADATHRVLLLSRPDDEETLVLDHPVKNTTMHNGRPIAWTIGPRVVRYASLAAQPATTSDLDAQEQERPR